MRSRRKANVHFIAQDLARRGPTRAFSLGFSWLSKIRGRDPRLGLEPISNLVQMHEGIECYLWWTPVHPGNIRIKAFQKLSPLFVDLYRRALPRIFRDWVKQSRVVVVESGIGVILIDVIKKINPAAAIIYIASDDMDTINVDPYFLSLFERHGHLLHSARVPSKRLAATVPPGPPVFYVPHGVSEGLGDEVGATPYGPGVHAVSVGSMLFDASFFEAAVELFPDIQFHVIGSGVPKSRLPHEVIWYPEMDFKDTLKFIKYASFGIAPYRQSNLPYYLADTSMKLMQYDFFSLPSVCPTFVMNEDHPLRFGYTPGDSTSIEAAIRSALACPRETKATVLNWTEVTDRILSPLDYPDTRI